MVREDAWPALQYERWAPTKKTLHMCAQMIGKARLALSPPLPEWLHTCLYLDPRGFSTGPVPHGNHIISMLLDVYQPHFHIRVDDGREASVALDRRCVAEIWSEFRRALDRLGVVVDLWEKPQEVPDVMPFSENRHDCTIVAEDAQRFLRILASINSVFEEFRSGFFGRTGVQFWWGGFDFAILLFTGKHLQAPNDRGYILRYDLDAEHLNAGFWAGDDTNPTPGFYGYLVPRPEGCENAPLTGWVEALGEWVIPYDTVRISQDPPRMILDFLQGLYGVATTLGGWPAENFKYTKPPPAPRR